MKLDYLSCFVITILAVIKLARFQPEFCPASVIRSMSNERCPRTVTAFMKNPCKIGWKYLKAFNTCIRLIPSKVKFETNNVCCRRFHSTLVKTNSSRKNREIQGIVTTSYWIGLKKSQNAWRWLGESRRAKYLNFLGGEVAGSLNCAFKSDTSSFAKGQWVETECDREIHGACEIQLEGAEVEFEAQLQKAPNLAKEGKTIKLKCDGRNGKVEFKDVSGAYITVDDKSSEMRQCSMWAHARREIKVTSDIHGETLGCCVKPFYTWRKICKESAPIVVVPKGAPFPPPTTKSPTTTITTTPTTTSTTSTTSTSTSTTTTTIATTTPPPPPPPTPPKMKASSSRLTTSASKTTKSPLKVTPEIKPRLPPTSEKRGNVNRVSTTAKTSVHLGPDPGVDSLEEEQQKSGVKFYQILPAIWGSGFLLFVLAVCLSRKDRVPRRRAPDYSHHESHRPSISVHNTSSTSADSPELAGKKSDPAQPDSAKQEETPGSKGSTPPSSSGHALKTERAPEINTV